MFPLLLGAALLAGLGFLVWKDKHGRTIRLVNGRRYAVAFRTNAPGFDVSMFPGFCEFSQPVLLQSQNYYEVQFTAQWCAANTDWDVPEGIAVSGM
jgi:hypothetical protein